MKKLIIIMSSMFALSTCAGVGQNRLGLLEIAKSAGGFETLVMALEQTGLDKEIKKAKDITLFAPTDQAFAKVPEETLAELLADKEALSEILKYHVSPEKLWARKVIKSKEVKTLKGKTIAVTANDQGVFLNDAKVTQADLRGKNGIIHIIDSVLLFDEDTPSNTFETEQNIDIKKYMGLWYEYARYENEFQTECKGTTAQYSLKKTPLLKRTFVEVINTCERADGSIQQGKAKAFVVNKETNATLAVSFVPVLNYFGLFAGDYNILKIGPDYEYALVGDKGRSTFWILTRTKEIPDSLYQELLDVAESKGFRRELIRKSPTFTR